MFFCKKTKNVENITGVTAEKPLKAHHIFVKMLLIKLKFLTNMVMIQVNLLLSNGVIKINSSQLHSMLPSYVKVRICEDSEKELVAIAKEWGADLVMGGITLSDGDIIHVATLLQDTSTRVGCCLPGNSTALTHFLHQMGFDIVCTHSNLIDTLCDVCKQIIDDNKPQKKRTLFSIKQLERHIMRILRQLAMPCDQKGYLYTKDAIGLWVLSTGKAVMITKMIYPEIAKCYHTTPACVERAIRTAIAKTWEGCSTYTKMRYFGKKLATQDKRPSNADFIGALANYILLQLENTNSDSFLGQ